MYCEEFQILQRRHVLYHCWIHASIQKIIDNNNMCILNYLLHIILCFLELFVICFENRNISGGISKDLVYIQV